LIGIVPLGMIAAALHSLWYVVAELTFGIAITYGTRMFSFYLAHTLDRAEAKESAINSAIESITYPNSDIPQPIDGETAKPDEAEGSENISNSYELLGDVIAFAKRVQEVTPHSVGKFRPLRSAYWWCVGLLSTSIVIEAVVFMRHSLLEGEGLLLIDLCIIVGILLLSNIARSVGLLFIGGTALHTLWVATADIVNVRWQIALFPIAVGLSKLGAAYFIGLSKSFSIEFAARRANQASFVKVGRTSLVSLIIVGIIFATAHDIFLLVASQQSIPEKVDRSSSEDGGYLSVIGVPQDKNVEAALGGNAWIIYLNGEIDTGAAKRFEDYVNTNHVPPYSIAIINSPGGNLMQGIKLGKSIRAHDFRTDVGRPNSNPPGRDYTSGECYSACTLAYVGGHFRFLQAGSHFGVHRFSILAGLIPSASCVTTERCDFACSQ